MSYTGSFAPLGPEGSETLFSFYFSGQKGKGAPEQFKSKYV